MSERGKRVLVVDDEPTICRALQISLQRAGYDVTAVESAEHAHSLLRQQRFDCMIADLHMPDLRGDVLFELARAIQPHLRYATLLTTGDSSEAALEMLEPCSCPVLFKPFDLTEITSLVGDLTRERRDATA